MADAFVKKTQATLGKVIKKPPLTDKLLKKPPFRFLHDVISEVIKTAGFMKGLYGKDEMDSQTAGKDKESKLAYLQKAIDVVAMVTGEDLTVRPSKIVAGHEPEKTNEFLQAIAMAISKKMDSKDAVQRVLKGEKPGSSKPSSEKPPKGEKDEPKSSKSQEEEGGEKERKRDRHKDREDRKRSASRDKEKDRDRSRDRGKDRERSKDREREKDDKNKDEKKDRDRDRDRERRHRDKDRHRDRDKDREGKHKKEEEEMAKQIHNDNDEEDMGPPDREGDEPAPGNRIPRPSSAKGQRRRPPRDGEDSDSDGEMEQQNQEAEQRAHEGEDRSHRRSRARESEVKKGQDRNEMVNGDDELPPQVQASRKMARPSSARPAPPRVKKQEALDDPAVRIGSGKVSNVIVDNAQNSDDDDDTFVVEEDQPAIEMEQSEPNDVDEDGEHGGLVKKILESKKELEGGSKAINKKDDKPVVVMDAAKRKERQIVAREIETLRSGIQTLTRSANPLGKIMDYVQEDMDSMQKELEMWKKENRQHELAIKREESITEEILEPLKSQLAELDQAIADRLDLISAVKANVLRNDEKIQKMMTSVTFASR